MRAAADAFETWRDTTPSERQRALLKFADAVEARADELVAAKSRNTGKPIGLTASEELRLLGHHREFPIHLAGPGGYCSPVGSTRQ
jgi:betaine-aldehyde dehydrogenase